ncbi:hypothetical protein Taro_051398 [Colocasia esculenta]|uniref:Uncharacterized protein n=1 Tax=Colocasia esculenta TaxID=4460 RepID=A0A843XH19_COLES|nr:hypothetical protein [Colocasia esculenta]
MEQPLGYKYLPPPPSFETLFSTLFYCYAAAISLDNILFGEVFLVAITVKRLLLLELLSQHAINCEEKPFSCWLRFPLWEGVKNYLFSKLPVDSQPKAVDRRMPSRTPGDTAGDDA